MTFSPLARTKDASSSRWRYASGWRYANRGTSSTGPTSRSTSQPTVMSSEAASNAETAVGTWIGISRPRAADGLVDGSEVVGSEVVGAELVGAELVVTDVVLGVMVSVVVSVVVGVVWVTAADDPDSPPMLSSGQPLKPQLNAHCSAMNPIRVGFPVSVQKPMPCQTAHSGRRSTGEGQLDVGRGVGARLGAGVAHPPAEAHSPHDIGHRSIVYTRPIQPPRCCPSVSQ